jgi:prepilin-type processing-associated H-X9-DG protein
MVAKSDYAMSTRISFKESEVIMNEILLDRGSSHTVMAGEKAVSINEYESGQGDGDRLSMFCGDSEDINRSVGPVTGDFEGGRGFGSAHAGGSQFVFCDGSVSLIEIGESPERTVAE